MATPKTKKKAAARRSKKPPSGGDCYEAAFNLIMSMGLTGRSDNYILVHAEVMGQGPLAGTPFGHAFVIDTATDTCLDYANGRNIELQKMIYYAIGQIDYIGNIHEYTWEEARDMALKHKHYGPWDLVTSSGL